MTYVSETKSTAFSYHGECKLNFEESGKGIPDSFCKMRLMAD